MTGPAAEGSGPAADAAHPADAVTLLRRLAHECRTPLTSVVGFSAMLAGLAGADQGPDCLDDDEVVAASHQVAAAAHRVQLVLDTLVVWATPWPVARAEPVLLSRAVTDALDDLTPVGGEPPVVDPVPEVLLRADPVLLRRLLRQLLDNALLHAAPGGVPRVWLTAAAAGDGWRLQVADDGRGVPAADRERVLRPYVRLPRDLDRPGAGLGLAVADRVARAHGGRLSVTATPGGGTTVVVEVAAVPSG